MSNWKNILVILVIYPRTDSASNHRFKMNLLAAFGPPGVTGPVGGIGVGGPSTGAK